MTRGSHSSGRAALRAAQPRTDHDQHQSLVASDFPEAVLTYRGNWERRGSIGGSFSSWLVRYQARVSTIACS